MNERKKPDFLHRFSFNTKYPKNTNYYSNFENETLYLNHRALIKYAHCVTLIVR